MLKTLLLAGALCACATGVCASVAGRSENLADRTEMVVANSFALRQVIIVCPSPDAMFAYLDWLYVTQSGDVFNSAVSMPTSCRYLYADLAWFLEGHPQVASLPLQANNPSVNGVVYSITSGFAEGWFWGELSVR